MDNELLQTVIVDNDLCCFAYGYWTTIIHMVRLYTWALLTNVYVTHHMDKRSLSKKTSFIDMVFSNLFIDK